MLKPCLVLSFPVLSLFLFLSAVSYLPADYDNVVRFELRGEFSEASARPHINMEEAD